MRTQILLIICICCYCIPLLGQKDLSGNYYNELGMFIKIENNKFTYIIPQTHSPIFYSDTLAECTFERVDNNFIEINSVSPLLSLQNELHISQNFETSIDDSIKVVFMAPYYSGSLTISITTDFTFQNLYEFHYSKNNNSIMLPKTTTSFLYGFAPQSSSIKTHDVEGAFYGIMCIEPLLFCNVESGKNAISITIPALNNSFFEKYYVKGEYVRIRGNNIIWKGEEFIKE